VDQEAGPRADQGEIRIDLLGTERRPDPEDARLLPERPVYQALERNEGKRRKWMEKHFRPLKERAETEGAKISSQMRRGAGPITTPEDVVAGGQTPS